jgi:hypothetical protein
MGSIKILIYCISTQFDLILVATMDYNIDENRSVFKKFDKTDPEQFFKFIENHSKKLKFDFF